MKNVIVRFSSIDGNYNLGIESSVLALMKKYKQNNRGDLEAGGQLFVMYKDNPDVISYITLPSKLDTRKCNLFMPHIPTMRKLINEKFKEELYYVGDWHTHFEVNPLPSYKDIESIHSRYKDSTHELKKMVIIIVGKGEDDLYVGLSDGEILLELKPS